MQWLGRRQSGGGYDAAVMLLLGVACLWAVFIVLLRTQPLVSNRWNVGAITLVIAGLTVASVATSKSRVDRLLYVRQFEIMDHAATPWNSVLFAKDRFFNLFLWVLSRVAPTSEIVLYATVTALVVVGFVVGARLLMPPWATLAALVTIVAMGMVNSYASVAIRQGLAAGCLLVAVGLVASGRWRWPAWGLLAAASLLHWTALPLAVGLAVLRRWTPTWKIQALAWLGLAAAFILGISKRLLGAVGWVPELSDYTSSEAYHLYGSSDLRLDFLAVSTVLFLVAAWGHRLVPEDPVYRRLTAAYVMFNAAFLLLGFVAFSDRLAAYSWFLAPLLFWYPLAKRDDGGRSVVPVLGILAVLGAGIAIGTIPALV